MVFVPNFSGQNGVLLGESNIVNIDGAGILSTVDVPLGPPSLRLVETEVFTFGVGELVAVIGQFSAERFDDGGTVILSIANADESIAADVISASIPATPDLQPVTIFALPFFVPSGGIPIGPGVLSGFKVILSAFAGAPGPSTASDRFAGVLRAALPNIVP